MEVEEEEPPMYFIGCVRGKTPRKGENESRWLCCDCPLIPHPDGTYTPDIWVMRRENIYHGA
jgi:hypothetical protein